VSSASRRAATETHQLAIATINAMFDRLDELTAARDRLTDIAPREPDDDPIQDAEALLEHARRLNGALDALRSAALSAATHRTRSELAADIGAKNSALFPRPNRQAQQRVRPTPASLDPAPSAGVAHQEASS
jgi:hypothetical protein